MKKIFSFFAAMLVAVAVNAQEIPSTDFAGGYFFSAEKAVLDGSIELNTLTETPYIRYIDASPCGTATWQITATKACKVEVTLNMFDNSWNNAVNSAYKNGGHIFEVKVLDGESEVGSVAESAESSAIGNIALAGEIKIPAAGTYSVQLLNNRAWSKCGIAGITLEAEVLPEVDFEDGFVCTPANAKLIGKVAVDGETLKWNNNSDASLNGVATWKIYATRACAVSATINNNAENTSGHCFSVAILDEEGNQVGDALAQEANSWSHKDEVLSGKISIPAAGEYTIQLSNSTAWSGTILDGITIGAQTIYLKPTDIWAAGDAQFAIYAFTDGQPEYFSEIMALAANETEIYSAVIPAAYTKLIFMRLTNGADHVAWDQIWNQSVDLTIDNDLFTITGWSDDKGVGEWSKYVAPEPIIPEPEAKFFITGTANLVGEELKWHADAIKVTEDSYTFENLAAGNYMLKVTLNGTWEGENNVKGYDALTEVADGITRGKADTEDNDNICFTLAEAGNVTVTYTGEAFKVEGKFHVEEPEPVNPFTTWFTGPDNWDGETESKLVYDAVSGKATVTIAIDKNAQWKAQVKYQGISSEPGKFYHVGVKMKANHAISGVTLKWEDNTAILMENASIALEENVEYVYNKPQFQSNAAGNGILVLDFGFAKAGDIIEIYDIVIEEVEAPVVDLEDGFYLIGLKGWNIYALAAEDKFAETEVEDEYKLLVDLENGDEFKVVAVADNKLGAWYPGEAGNYHVDLAHAGEGKPIFFRPKYDGGGDWHGNCIFIPANEEPVNPIVETYFATEGWAADDESSAVWDAENEKIIVTIAKDKFEMWQAQVKYQTISSELGKWYNIRLKMRANNAVSGVTVKWDDNTGLLTMLGAISLGAEAEYELDQTLDAQAAGGNGIMVFDFGFAKAGDVIEIYEISIEEIEAPELSYFLVGTMNEWILRSEYKLTPNDKAEGEWMLTTTVAEGDKLKVISAQGDRLTWFPAEAEDYVVSAALAGKVDIFFRPDYMGGEGWYEKCIYVAKHVPGTALDNTNAEVKAVKVLRDGMLLIEKNGVIYNIMGNVVK